MSVFRKFLGYHTIAIDKYRRITTKVFRVLTLKGFVIEIQTPYGLRASDKNFMKANELIKMEMRIKGDDKPAGD